MSGIRAPEKVASIATSIKTVADAYTSPQASQPMARAVAVVKTTEPRLSTPV